MIPSILETLYHKERAPTGRVFDSTKETVNLHLLEQDGWVDDASKLGINLWQHMGAEGMVASTKARYDRGEVRGIDALGSTPKDADLEELLRKERERADKAIKERDAAMNALRAEEPLSVRKKRKDEQLADARADAYKGTKRPSLQSGEGGVTGKDKTPNAGTKRRTKAKPKHQAPAEDDSPFDAQFAGEVELEDSQLDNL